MKKFIFLGLGLLCALGVQAQRGWSIEARLGPQVAIEGDNSYLGLYTGAIGQYRFGRVLALESGLLYSLNVNEDVYCQTLHMPMLIKAYVGKGWNVSLGPQFDFPFMSGLTDGTASNWSWWSGISLLGGVGYDFPFGLTLHADYTYGSPWAFHSFDSGRNPIWHVVRLGAGWRFGKKK